MRSIIRRKKKQKQTYHVNLLKEWKEPWGLTATVGLVVQESEVEQENSGWDIVTQSTMPELICLPSK